MTRNFNAARYNKKVYKVHLSRDELIEIFPDDELKSLGEVTEAEEDTALIDNPDYDFVEELSKVRYAPAD